MEVYTTEEEQIESIKKWWKENGRSVIAGVVIGLVVVFGWRGWVEHKASVGEQAAVQYQQLVRAVATGRTDSVDKQTEFMMTEFPSTPYALFSALADARVNAEQGEMATARARLEEVLANSDDQGVREIARLRLARLLFAEGDLDAAEHLSGAAELASFAGEYAELAGDIAVARKDPAAAADAYRRALEKQVADAALVQMKLDDLGLDAASSLPGA